MAKNNQDMLEVDKAKTLTRLSDVNSSISSAMDDFL